MIQRRITVPPTRRRPAATPRLPRRTPSRSRVGDAFRFTVRAILSLLKSPFVLISWMGEFIMSRRALAISILAFMALLTISPWMRPPISKDLRGGHIPVGAFPGSSLPQEAVLEPHRRWRLDSIAVPLLAVIVVGVVVALVDPRRVAPFFGLLGALGIAATAAAMFNHPQFVDALDREFFQREEIRKILHEYEDLTMSATTRPRIALHGLQSGLFSIEPRREDPLHAVFFLCYGQYIVPVGLLALIAWMRGRWVVRFRATVAWTLLGVVLAGAVTARRWAAEFYWTEIARCESANDFEGARKARQRLLEIVPSFADTERMWVTTGRLDLRQGGRTLAARLFLAKQQKAFTDHLAGQITFSRALEERPDSRALHDMTADFFIRTGKNVLFNASDSSAEYYFRLASETAPWRYDCRIAHATAMLRSRQSTPEVIEERLNPLLPLIGDRLVKADIHSMLGDAYFREGDMHRARIQYAASMKAFRLPRFVNPHAQEGLLGM